MDGSTCSLPTNQLNELLYIPLSDGRYGGYKLEILKQNLTAIEEIFVVCPSCKSIMKNASFSAGKNMCKCCCPESEQTVPVESVRETVAKLPCGCPLDSKGCAWSGVIGELESHLSVCEHLMVPCPFVEYGCEVGLVRRLEMQLHLKEFSTQHLLGRIMKVEEAFSEIDFLKKENGKAFKEIDCLKTENRRAFKEIDCLKTENGKSFKEIDILKMEDRKLEEENRKAFKEINFLKQQNQRAFKEIDFLRFQQGDLRHTINGKELRGFQFIISNVSEHIKSDNMIKGPIFYVDWYNIQVYYEFSSYLFLYIMRIPGVYDAELRVASVGLSHYEIINSEDSKVLSECSKKINHSLVFDKISPQISCFDSTKFVVKNALTIRLFLELKFE